MAERSGSAGLERFCCRGICCMPFTEGADVGSVKRDMAFGSKPPVVLGVCGP